MTPEEFRPPMEAALRDYGIAPRTYKGAELIKGMWERFKGFKAEAFAKALKSACEKSPDYMPSPVKVSAAMDLIAPPKPKPPAVEVEQPSPEPTPEDYERGIAWLKKNGMTKLAARMEKAHGRD